ncbi:hypothetical protein [Flexithrix dorotheae]|nr:hypothetical protein [Flexithrix dorotheae]
MKKLALLISALGLLFMFSCEDPNEDIAPKKEQTNSGHDFDLESDF